MANDKTVLLDISTLLSGEEKVKAFDLEFSPDIDDPDIVPEGMVRFAGVVKECSGFVRMEGKLSFSFSSPCARCLETVRSALEVNVELDGFELDKIPDQDGDYFTVEDSRIDLGAIVYEYLSINLPTRLLCSEDCKGLCPHCGKNLNLEDCDCAKKQVDPRLAGLMDFFNE